MEEFKKVKLLNPIKNKEDNERLVLNKHTDALDRLHKTLSSGDDFLMDESRQSIFRDICKELVRDRVEEVSKKFNLDNDDEFLKFVEEANKIIDEEENFLKDILINNHKDNIKYQELLKLIFKYRLRH